MKRTFLVLMLCTLIFGCASPESRFPPHKEAVYITSGTLPDEVKFEFIENLFVEIDPAPAVAVKKVMADKARKLGGDAIIQFVTGYKPRFALTFSARYGSGQVVKITENKDAMPKYGIELY